MKKYLFLTIVLISAIITGFATKPDKVYEGEDQMALYWFVDGNYTGRQNTILNEVPLSGCPNTGIFHCEDGYDAADQQTFRAVISQSSLIGESASVLSWVLPVFELITSLLLFIPASRLVGLLLSFVLMILFTGYVAYNLLYVSNLPCSCGGVVSSLSWNQHLVMNIFLTVLSIVGIIIHTDHKLFIAINRASRTPV